MRNTITRAAVILPFEEAFSATTASRRRTWGIRCSMARVRLPSRTQARAKLGLPENARVLALFPGSRRGELAQHLESFAETALELGRRMPDLRVIVSVAPGMTIDRARAPFKHVEGDLYAVWRAADAALVKSGTSTLEAALAGCPLIVAYRVGRANYEIARRLVRGISYIGLVNLVVGKSVAPEFIQNAMQPLAMANALEPLLVDGSPERATMLAALADVRAALGEAGAASASRDSRSRCSRERCRCGRPHPQTRAPRTLECPPRGRRGCASSRAPGACASFTRERVISRASLISARGHSPAARPPGHLLPLALRAALPHVEFP